MPDIKISQLNEMTAADLSDSDILVVNDVSVSTTKSITFGNLLSDFSKNVVDSATGAKCTGDFVVDNELTVGGDFTTTATMNVADINADSVKCANALDTQIIKNTETNSVRFENDVKLTDNLELRIGDNNDLKLRHDGSHSFVEEGGTGSLYLQANTGIALRNKVSGKNYISAARSGTNGGKTRLWYQEDSDNDGLHDGEHYMKLETYDSGVNIFSFANARRLRINQEGDAPNVPSAANEGGQVGEIRWDANHIYIYVAANTWKRVAISTWT